MFSYLLISVINKDIYLHKPIDIYLKQIINYI